MGHRKGPYRILVGRFCGNKSNKNLGIDGRIILKRIFKKGDRETWNKLIWLRIGTRGGWL